MESIFKKQRILETILRVFVFEEKKRKKERREKRIFDPTLLERLGLTVPPRFPCPLLEREESADRQQVKACLTCTRRKQC